MSYFSHDLHGHANVHDDLTLFDFVRYFLRRQMATTLVDSPEGIYGLTFLT